MIHTLAENSGDLAPATVVLWVVGAIIATALTTGTAVLTMRFLKRGKSDDNDTPKTVTIAVADWLEFKNKMKTVDDMRAELLTLRKWRTAARKLVLRAQEDLRDGHNDRAMLALDFFRDLEETHLGDA